MLKPGFRPLQAAGRWRNRQWFVPLCVLGIVALICLFLIVRPGGLRGSHLPDFSAIDSISERKAAFFTFLEPFVESANADILEQRERLVGIREQLSAGRLNKREAAWFMRTAEEYGMEIPEDEPVRIAQADQLLRRVDIIPPSMALAQAALESGWGTSRFAQKGNNLFGIRCYTRGCGLIPRKRAAGATYEVTKYRSPKECFLDYIRNLNSNTAYTRLWQLRERARKNDQPITGLLLADGLSRYSEESWGYVSKIQRVIQSNKLQAYD